MMSQPTSADYCSPELSRRAGAVNATVGNPVWPFRVESGSGVCPASNYENPTMTDWPLRSYLELGALPSAVPCARLHTKHVLREWGVESLTESVELVVSELTTNAIAAAEGLIGSRYNGRWNAGVPPVRLWLCSEKERVLVQVWDGNDRLPEVQGDDLLAERGRGLLLVETRCEEWGTFVPQGGSGKVVWAICQREDPFEE